MPPQTALTSQDKDAGNAQSVCLVAGTGTVAADPLSRAGCLGAALWSVNKRSHGWLYDNFARQLHILGFQDRKLVRIRQDQSAAFKERQWWRYTLLMTNHQLTPLVHFVWCVTLGILLLYIIGPSECLGGFNGWRMNAWIAGPRSDDWLLLDQYYQ